MNRRNRGRAAALLAAVGTAGFGMLLFACSSTTVGTGGSGDDDDDDGGKDSGTVTTRDAGPETSTGRVDSGLRDAAPADAAPGADASCAPGNVSNGYTFVDPVTSSGACLAAQVTAYVSACGNDGSVTACNTFEAANGGCFACMQTDIDAGAWGAVVDDPISGEEFANTGGCFEKLDTSSAGEACAVAAESVRLCEIQACEVSCEGQTFDTFTDCEMAADDGVCADSLSTYSDCLDDDAAAMCEGSAYDDTVTLVGNALCVNGSR